MSFPGPLARFLSVAPVVTLVACAGLAEAGPGADATVMSQRVEALEGENEALSEEVTRLRGLIGEQAAEPTNGRSVYPGDGGELAPPIAAVRELAAPGEVAAPTPEARPGEQGERSRTVELERRIAAGERKLEDVEARLVEMRTTLQVLRQELARRRRDALGFEELIRSAKGELDHALARLAALREEISE